jgi:hypothetical protein
MKSTPANAAAHVSSDADSPAETIRIEPDRRRLLLRVLASGFAFVAICVGFVVASLHLADNVFEAPGIPPELRAALRATGMPWWSLIALGIALVTGGFGLLRNVYRLQDGDPALVVSPRGLSFKPTVFGETSRIPWSAIRGVRLRRFKQHRFIGVQVEDVERYAAHIGARARLRRLFDPGATTELSINSPMAREAWARTESLLQRYLARYGDRGLDASASAAARPRTAR